MSLVPCCICYEEPTPCSSFASELRLEAKAKRLSQQHIGDLWENKGYILSVLSWMPSSRPLVLSVSQ